MLVILAASGNLRSVRIFHEECQATRDGRRPTDRVTGKAEVLKLPAISRRFPDNREFRASWPTERQTERII